MNKVPYGEKQKYQPRCVGFASFHGRNVPSMAEFKLSVLTVYIRSQEDKCSQHHYDAILSWRNDSRDTDSAAT